MALTFFFVFEQTVSLTPTSIEVEIPFFNAKKLIQTTKMGGRFLARGCAQPAVFAFFTLPAS
jgi:hypothetical protein